MAEQEKVHCYASLARPYESVRRALHRLSLPNSLDAPGHVHSVSDHRDAAGLPAGTRVTLGWEPNAAPGCHPVSCAELYASEMSSAETQMEVEAHWPALRFGAGGHAAEVCARQLLESLIERVRVAVDKAWGDEDAAQERAARS